MLEKLLHHKLLTEGERGQGVVTKRHDQGMESSTQYYAFLFELEGHVKFPDGSESQFRSELLNSHKVGDIQEGAIVPVRYDASDHGKVVLDVVTLEETEVAQRQHDKEWQEHEKERQIAEADAKAAQANLEGDRQSLS
jgi:hypothetical protein